MCLVCGFTPVCRSRQAERTDPPPSAHTRVWLAGRPSWGVRDTAVAHMDRDAALRRSQKPIDHSLLHAFSWWPKSRLVVAEQFIELCDGLSVSREIAYRAMQLFERASLLHGKGQVSFDQTLLDAGVAFMIAIKFSEPDRFHIEELAASISIAESTLRQGELCFLEEENWNIYSPTAHQFVDVLASNNRERELALLILDSHALSAEVSYMTAEELANGAIAFVKKENNPRVQLLRSLYAFPSSPSPQLTLSPPQTMTPATVCGKRTRCSTSRCSVV